MTAISTRDFAQVAANAAPSRRGFVLYDKKDGWKQAGGASGGGKGGSPSATGDISAESWLVFGAAAVVAFAVVRLASD